MRRTTLTIALLLTIPIFAMCKLCSDSAAKREEAQQLPYSYGKAIATVESERLDEISGMATSSRYRDCFWVNNDSGDEPNIYLINLSGELLATLSIEGASNRDWEGITIGDGYIYIGEIGDNNATYLDKKIYRIEEPKGIDINSREKVINIDEFETMRFNFADGQRDCETLMFDPIAKELVMVSKREERNILYTTPFIATEQGEILEIESSATLEITSATSGEISPNGEKILIKNYTNIYYWQRNNSSESLAQTLASTPTPLAYDPEPQGEAIAWSYSSDKFYTVSEKVGNISAVIYEYSSL